MQAGNKKTNIIQWSELIGSSFLFAAAYLVLYISYDYVTALAAAHFGLEPTLFYDNIEYENNSDWYPHAVVRTFSVGAFFMLFLGITFYLFYYFIRKSYIFLRLFTLWSSLISFAILAQRLISVPFSDHFNYRDLDSEGLELAIVSSYLYFKDTTELAMAFLGFVLIVAIGYLYAKPFLQTAWSPEQIGSEKERLKFLRAQVLLPCLVGGTVVTLVVFPVNLFANSFSLGAALICLTSMTVHAMLMGPLKVPRQKKWERWPLVPIAAFILVMVAIKTILTTGLAIPTL
ncbi:MAG: hypothetical protein ACPGD8_06825 [Flavobacteriales bacterium]